MNDAAVKIIANGPNEDCFPIINGFLETNEKLKAFPSIQNDIKKELYTAIFNRIRDPTTPSDLLKLSLNFLRVLSREKTTLEQALDISMIETILKLAGLKPSTEYPNCGYPEMLESLKVIFNMVFQSSQVQEMFINNDLLEGIINTLKDYDLPSTNLPMNVKYFTFRVLFIITALCQKVVPKIRRELNGLVYLNKCLDKLAHQTDPYDDQTVDVICEIQKVLYNLIHDLVPNKPDKSFVLVEEDAKILLNIAQLARLFLLHDCKCAEKKKELNSHSIDLLAGVTNDCFTELLVEANDSSRYKFEKYDMEAIEVMANFLHQRLDGVSGDRTMSESLTPVLSIMIRMTKNVRPIRKYLKKRILPPLTKADVMERPEVGHTLRNKLCVLLTSPGYITELVSTFLFTLCKENVQRLIKYTGFGNAAGLLANRGLLLGGQGNVDDFSDDSQDSDTEEYKKISPMINDVEGRVQVEHSDPFEGMTEEQKEHEAMELVKAIDNLHRKKVIQPCRIGPDGKPLAVDHICELIEQGDSTIIRSHKNGSSDSE